MGIVSIGATYNYTDKQLASADSPSGWLPSRDIVNLNVNWASIAGWLLDASLFVNNIFEEEYETFIGGCYSAVGFEVRHPGEPRVYGLRLRMRFGD